MDNASVNDAMLRQISINPAVSAKGIKSISSTSLTLLISLTFIELFDQLKIDYDPEEHRLRCHSHILNLVGDSFLFKTHGEALAKHNNDYSSSEAVTELEFAL
ncbi:hypothetical protein DL98DRAFT_533064 [Cadophora sp. DSE1049]|nr:hypothetical protein DL98DRAFT_533064 [Cadophora sp. DSE1049]